VDLAGAWTEAKWSTPMDGVTYQTVDVLRLVGRLFAGSHGYIKQLHAATGTVLHSRLLTSAIPKPFGDYGTRICTDGENLYAGVLGYAYKLLINDEWQGMGLIENDFLTPTGWHGAWSPMLNGAPNAQSATAAVGVPQLLDVLGIGTNSTLYHTSLPTSGWQDCWSANFDFAPSAMRSITTCRALDNGLEILAVGADGTLAESWLSPRSVWQPWTKNLGNVPAAISSAALGRRDSGNIEAFVIDRTGVLYHNYLTMTGWLSSWIPNFNAAPLMNCVATAVGPRGALEVFGIKDQ
jgi:hypothetical protein